MGGDGARPLGPAVAAERIGWIDVLRGIAILGILPVNAPYFAYPMWLAEDPAHPAGGGSLAAATLVRVFFQSKCLTLFAFLFGVGLGLQFGRAGGALGRVAPTVLRRLGALLVLGLLHALLVWWGDILFAYACLGLVLVWLVAAPPRVLLALATPAVLAGTGVLLLLALAAASGDSHGFAGWWAHEPLDGRGAELATAPWRVYLRHLAGTDPDLEVAVYAGGSYARVTALRAVTWGTSLFGAFVLHGPRLGGLLLLGLAVARLRTPLDPADPAARRLHARLAALALPAGLAGEWLATRWDAEGATVAAHFLGSAVHQVASLATAAGLLGAVAWAAGRRPDAAWARPLAAVGRTALSCYLLQSLVMTTLFYSHGLALFDQVGRVPLLGICVGVWVLELLAATLWLRRFRMGPAEWLWRCATYARVQPLRRESR